MTADKKYIYMVKWGLTARSTGADIDRAFEHNTYVLVKSARHFPNVNTPRVRNKALSYFIEQEGEDLLKNCPYNNNYQIQVIPWDEGCRKSLELHIRYLKKQMKRATAALDFISQ